MVGDWLLVLNFLRFVSFYQPPTASHLFRITLAHHLRIYPHMSGSLHIFRREIVNGLPQFQINYNLAGRSFAKVVDGDHQLNEFLEVIAALPGDVIEDAWKQLDSSGSAQLVDVKIPESQAVANDMKSAPSDF